MIRIALDLELEQPKTRKQTEDSMLDTERIIQVGYVFFDDNTGDVVDQSSDYIHIPNLRLSKFIKELTGVTDDDIASGISLERSINVLHEKAVLHGADRKILTWGGGDQESIRSELPTNYLWKFGRSALNVKHLYQVYREANGENPSSGLKKSLRGMGLSFEGRAHDALTDALNTARIFIELKNKLKRG